MEVIEASVRSDVVETARLRMHVLTTGRAGRQVVLFVHGNISSSRFWEPTLAALPTDVRGIAVDLRGSGESDPGPIDATRGLRDFSDDLHALLVALGLADGAPVHVVGWSMGGGVAQQLTIDHPGVVASLVLVAPMSPFGLGGTRDASGTPVWPDHAGSGAGTANAEFVARLARADRSGEANSPRWVMNSSYFRPPFRADPVWEEAFVDAMLSTRVGDDHYPGDVRTSENWPGVAPGLRGIRNAISPKYCDLSGIAGVEPKPDVLWVRGPDDRIVSDTSFSDVGYLGQLGIIRGWPGADVYPAQPMIGQVRHVLSAYRAAGGRYTEELIPETGHSPHVERPERFRELLLDFLATHGR